MAFLMFSFRQVRTTTKPQTSTNIKTSMNPDVKRQKIFILTKLDNLPRKNKRLLSLLK